MSQIDTDSTAGLPGLAAGPMLCLAKGVGMAKEVGVEWVNTYDCLNALTHEQDENYRAIVLLVAIDQRKW